MSYEFMISPMDKKLLEENNVEVARKYKKLLYEPTPTGSLDVLVLDYFGYVIRYFHVAPRGEVDWQVEIVPRYSIHNKTFPDIVRDIREAYLDCLREGLKLKTVNL